MGRPPSQALSRLAHASSAQLGVWEECAGTKGLTKCWEARRIHPRPPGKAACRFRCHWLFKATESFNLAEIPRSGRPPRIHEGQSSGPHASSGHLDSRPSRWPLCAPTRKSWRKPPPHRGMNRKSFAKSRLKSRLETFQRIQLGFCSGVAMYPQKDLVDFPKYSRAPLGSAPHSSWWGQLCVAAVSRAVYAAACRSVSPTISVRSAPIQNSELHQRWWSWC